jgi:competence protein ComEC
MRHPRPGQHLSVGDVRIDVLGPEHCAHGTDSDPNNDSLVLRVSVGGDAVLFPGDAEVAEQADILRY